MIVKNIKQEILKRFHVNESGQLVRTKSGKIAGESVGINYERYLTHRVIHMIEHGEWETPGIRYSNTADKVVPNVNNYSGYKGVSKSRNRYVANISYQGKKIYLGSFDTAQQASHAYLAKRAELFKKNT